MDILTQLIRECMIEGCLDLSGELQVQVEVIKGFKSLIDSFPDFGKDEGLSQQIKSHLKLVLLYGSLAEFDADMTRTLFCFVETAYRLGSRDGASETLSWLTRVSEEVPHG